MNLHLSENLTLREVFGLGDPLPLMAEGRTKLSKQDRVGSFFKLDLVKVRLTSDF
jgi:hypothetical protein